MCVWWIEYGGVLGGKCSLVEVCGVSCWEGVSEEIRNERSARLLCFVNSEYGGFGGQVSLLQVRFER